ncbi:MAG: aryl-sulfate sulfotransferase [Candidatus Thorarchaeota archaeon]|nr:aryl-sulfate sulfotransferase [Candidatus Thorarchaeota archaeon]
MKSSTKCRSSRLCRLFANKSRYFLLVLILSLGLNAQLTPRNSIDDSERGTNQSDIFQTGPEIEIKANSTSNSVLPTDSIELEHHDGAFDGYNLFVLQRMNDSTRQKELFLIIMDMDGYSIAERKIGTNFYLADCPAEWINATTIMYGTPEGVVLWNYYSNKTTELGFRGHHEYEYNHENDTIFTIEYDTVEIGGKEYLYDRIVEYNLTGDVVWSFHTHDFISPQQACPLNDTFYSKPDITHSNTIFFDEEEDVCYYNARNVNTFYKIDHSTSEVIWGLGEYGNFTLLNQRGIELESLFYHPHAVEKVDSHTFILFDNDYHNHRNLLSRQSRILELVVDESSRTASVSWTWSPSIEYWSYIWGDADRLPNENRLGVFGTRTHPYSPVSARLVEVDNAGNIVWKLDFPKGDGYRYGVYRMERFRFTPIIDASKSVDAFANEDITLVWNTSFNFKPKRTLSGEYCVYLNGTIIEDGQILYDKYWRYRELSVNLGELKPGSYNLTLSITDSANHTTTKSIDLNVLPGISLEIHTVLLLVVGFLAVAGVSFVFVRSRRK